MIKTKKVRRTNVAFSLLFRNENYMIGFLKKLNVLSLVCTSTALTRRKKFDKIVLIFNVSLQCSKAHYTRYSAFYRTDSLLPFFFSLFSQIIKSFLEQGFDF